MRVKFIRRGVIDSLSAKIFIGIACSMAIISVGLYTTIVRIQTDMLLKRITSEGLTTVSLLADNLKLAVYSDDKDAITEIINSVMLHSDTLGVSVFDADLVPIVVVKGKNATVEIKPPDKANLSRIHISKSIATEGGYDSYVFFSSINAKSSIEEENILLQAETAPPTGSGGNFGYVAVARSKSILTSGIQDIVNHALRLVAIFLTVCVVATFVMVYVLTEPLRRLINSLRLRYPAYAKLGDMETLDTTYGQLILDLDRAFSQIGSFNMELAEKVGERTAELEQLNEALEARVLERTKTLEETHRQLLHAEKLSSMGKLVASIAHEINTPLCGLKLTLAEIRQKYPLTEEDVKILDLGLSECNRMANLIDNLRLSTAPAAGKLSNFALKEIFDAIFLLSRRILKKKNISFECFYEDDEQELYGDKSQLFQVFLNLVHNSIESIDVNSNGHIRITTCSNNETITIAIEDSGIGIPNEHIQKIFEPFFTTKLEVKGTGLGLPIAMGIIKHHGGSINVSRLDGGGTRMMVVMPVRNN